MYKSHNSCTEINKFKRKKISTLLLQQGGGWQMLFQDPVQSLSLDRPHLEPEQCKSYSSLDNDDFYLPASCCKLKWLNLKCKSPSSVGVRRTVLGLDWETKVVLSCVYVPSPEPIILRSCSTFHIIRWAIGWWSNLWSRDFPVFTRFKRSRHNDACPSTTTKSLEMKIPLKI